ncbi:MAG: hypothetical protein DDT33_01748 [Firmicutes bacterium]|nr:hypothetical protein [Bacillota bacterium]
MWYNTDEMVRRLTAKQEKFITSYIELGNITKAAIAAGYAPSTARKIGWETLQKPLVVARRKELEERVAGSKVMAVRERRERLSEISRKRGTYQVDRSSIIAIDTLNKMDRVYEPERGGDSYTQINIILKDSDQNARHILSKIIDGERLQLAPPHKSDSDQGI